MFEKQFPLPHPINHEIGIGFIQVVNGDAFHFHDRTNQMAVDA